MLYFLFLYSKFYFTLKKTILNQIKGLAEFFQTLPKIAVKEIDITYNTFQPKIPFLDISSLQGI